MKITKLFDRLNAGENASRAIRIEPGDELAGYPARLAFLTPEGKSYVSDPLEFTGGAAEYALPGVLLDGPGILLVQAVFYDGEEFIRKSAVQEYTVFPSVSLAGASLEETAQQDGAGLSEPSQFYETFLTHAHDDLYYRKAALDALLAEKADKNESLAAGTDREAYLADTLRCIASYLVREADCDCVSRSLGTDMFAAVYNDTGRSYLHLYNQGSGPFTWDERTEGGCHKLYCNCSGFLALITKCRDYLSSPYKKAFDALDCHIVGGGCAVYDSAASYAARDYALYQGKAYQCTAAADAEPFDPAKWTEQTVAEFSLKYMRYEESKSYAVGDYALLDGSLYRCVTAADNEPWDAAKWEFIRGGLTLKDSLLLAFSTEKGNIHEKPYTMDFKNLIYTYYMAFIQDHGGNPLKRILKRDAGSGFYYPAAVSSAENFRQLEDGDLLFFSRPQSKNYRKISHCGYYLSSLDRLNAVGAAEYGGITFRAVDHGTNSGPEWGYVVECAGSFPEGSGRNTIRISTLKGMMNNSGTDNPYCECFFSKPYANPFNSTKAARLLSFTSTTDERLWFGNRVSNKFATDPDGVPYGSYWLQPGDGKAHLHTVTAATLGAEGYLLSRLLPHGLDYEDYPYEDYPDETLDINFIQNGVYRCDKAALAARLVSAEGVSRLPADMTNEEKVFLLVQTGGIEEEETEKARYGVQLIFPSLAGNGVIWMRSRNEGYYTDGVVSATGAWGAWKKIFTYDSFPAASADTAGKVKVGSGLAMTDGAIGVDPNGRLSVLNMGVTGVKLTSGADLDALGNGVWRCDTSDLAASVLHKPPVVTNDLRAFTVLECGSVQISASVVRYGLQFFMSNSSMGEQEVFFRQRGYAGGWREWRSLSEAVAEEAPDSAGRFCERTVNLNTASQGRYRIIAGNANRWSISAVSSGTYFGMREAVPCEADTDYTFCCYDWSVEGTVYTNLPVLSIAYYNGNGEMIGSLSVTRRAIQNPLLQILRSPAQAAYMACSLYSDAGLSANTKIAIVKASTAPTQYVPPYTAADSALRNAPVRLKVGTYNAGLYGYGVAEGRPAYGSTTAQEKMNGIKRFLATEAFDVLCLQENQTYLAKISGVTPLTLEGVPLYASSDTAESSGALTGTYYVWEQTITNERIRVTDAADHAGSSQYLLGWIDVAESAAVQDWRNRYNTSTALYRYPLRNVYTGRAFLTICTNETLHERSTGPFTAKYSDNTRYWAKAVIYPKGRRVAIANCHLANQEEATGVRTAQMQELIQMLADEECAIVFGDWNVRSLDEFDVMTQAGYTMLNGSYLPAERTYNTDGDYTDQADPTHDLFLDNIAVKGSIRGYGTVRNIYAQSLSDHLPVVGQVTVD